MLPPLRALARRVVAASAPPAVQPLWTRLYRALARVGAAALWRALPLRSIYLIERSRNGELQPGLSDIDLVVVADRSPELDARFERVYGRLKRWVPFLEPKPLVLDAGTVQERANASPRYQYLVRESGATWRLLKGEPFLERMDTTGWLPAGLAFYPTLGFLWPSFRARFLGPTAGPPDGILDAGSCYRCAGDLARAELALLHDVRTYSRAEALRRLLPHVEHEDRRLIEELLSLKGQRFLPAAPSLPERTCELLLRRTGRTFGHLSERSLFPARQGSPPARHEPDGGLEELGVTAREWEHLQGLMEAARSEWPSYRGAYLAPTVFHGIHDLVLALEIEGAAMPGLEGLRRLVRQESESRARLSGGRPLPREIFLYLLLPAGAVFMGGQSLPARTERLLHPAVQPDFFALIQRAGFRLEGRGAPPPPAGRVTEMMRAALEDSEARLRAPEYSPPQGTLYRYDLAAVFWKRLQVALVRASLGEETVRYPVTVPAIERRLAELGIELPRALHPLRRAVSDLSALPACEDVRPEAAPFLADALDRIEDRYKVGRRAVPTPGLRPARRLARRQCPPVAPTTRPG